jgi:SAM-dependent methyltransferase
MDRSRQASAELAVRWSSTDAVHADRLYCDKVNFWRDLFPGDLGERLAGAEPGEVVAVSVGPGEMIPAQDPGQVRRVPASAFRRRLSSGAAIDPRPGRFYPRGLLTGAVETFAQDRRPFRYLGEGEGGIRVDLNHPLARYPLAVEGRVIRPLNEREERGGRCNDLPEELTAGGPGLQGGYPGVETDFLSGRPFERQDPRDDTVFYAEPRLVHHIDATARAHIQALYGRLLRPGMQVLDLMSSWTSHLPEGLDGLTVTGLGMNAAELRQNPRLAERLIHDLNREPHLPFADGSFDAAICTVSVEYLTRPLEVVQEVARVLRPGAPLAVTFSDRWFPPKVVRVWTELHPFERMGLVEAYLRSSGGFDRPETESVRGWPRPEDDKYARTVLHSDPVFAVWANRRAEA